MRDHHLIIKFETPTGRQQTKRRVSVAMSTIRLGTIQRNRRFPSLVELFLLLCSSQRILAAPSIPQSDSLTLPSLEASSSLPLVSLLRGGEKFSRMTTSKNDKQNHDTFQQVGGGAVNEKKRAFEKPNAPSETTLSSPPSSFYDPCSNRSHLMHAIEGLDRYPNYLSRWSIRDTEQLEEALSQRLQQVRKQKEEKLKRRQGFRKLVESICEKNSEFETLLQIPQSWEEIERNILDPRASKAVLQFRFLKPSTQQKDTASIPTIQDVISGVAKIELNAGYLEELMDEESYDVYSFPLLSKSFCYKLQQFVKAITEELESNTIPGMEHLKRGMVRDVDNLGLKWLNDLLFHLIVRPISRHIYKDTEIHGELDWRQAFIAAYSVSPTKSKPRQRLVSHTDDAEITLNINVGDVFQGGALKFWGLRGTPDAGSLLGEYEPEVGRALLHAGRHLHEVTEVKSGDRFAYVMWTRSWSGTRAQTCPCCWLNRRESNDCICGPRWN